MINFAPMFGVLRGAFTRKGGFYQCSRQAANISRSHWISTTNNARLWYLKRLDLYQTEKPYHINLPANALGRYAQSNEVSQEYAGIRIKSLRGFENDFNLDKNGFQIFEDIDCGDDADWSTHSASAAPTSDVYADPDIVRKKYYPAIERLLKKKLGAQMAKAFTHDVWLPPYIIRRLSRQWALADLPRIGSSKRAAVPSSASWHGNISTTCPGRTRRQATFSKPFRMSLT